LSEDEKFMARIETWPCSSCAYWQPYPSWEGVGTCDNTLSRDYSRMAIGTGPHCEYFAAPPTAVSSGGSGVTREPGSTLCEGCHYWLPLGTMPRVGLCDNPSSRYFEGPVFSDRLTEECFILRSLENLEFMWCQSHRQTIHSTDLAYHKECDLYVSSVSLPVEDQMELTLAGD